MYFMLNGQVVMRIGLCVPSYRRRFFQSRYCHVLE